MQNAALAAVGLGEDWRYEAIEVSPEGFEQRVKAMAAADFAGANVTVPHKAAALALSTRASEAARQIGAANTLTFGADGIAAENTDAPGLIAALPHDPGGANALVLGAGGAARAVVWALNRAGARVQVWNRTATRAEAVCAELGGRPWRQGDGNASEFDLVLNCSAAGLGGGDPFADLPVVPGDFRTGQVVVDMVYGAAPSRLLAAAEEAGAELVDGLEILVRQGAISFEIWTGQTAPLSVMRDAARSR